MAFGTSSSPGSVLHATIAQYIKNEEVNVGDRKHKLLPALQSGGRVKMNNSGDELKWAVKIRRRALQYGGHFNAISFPVYDLRENAVLPWRNCYIPEAVEKFSKLKNRGAQAIVKLYTDTVKEIMADMKEGFALDLYVDGNAVGNTKKIHGLESCLSVSGAGTFVGTNNDTYAGLSTARGDFGGSWTGSWPSGYGDAEYMAWTPLVVDYTNSNWSASTKTWPNTCSEAIRYGLIKRRKFGAMIDIGLLEDELYRKWLDNLDDKERIMVQSGKGKGRLANLGFDDTVMYDGCEFTWEYGMPADTGYGLQLSDIEILSMQSSLFGSEAMDHDISTQTDRHLCDFYGNMRLNPFSLVKWKNITG
jgi:hypothetical protein